MEQLEPQINETCEHVGLDDGICNLIEETGHMPGFSHEECECLPCLAGLFAKWSGQKRV